MSLASAPVQSGSPFVQKKLNFLGVVRSEALKFRTLTTNWVMTGVLALVTVGLGMLGGVLANSLFRDAADKLQGSGIPAADVYKVAAEGTRGIVYSSGAMGMDMANMLVASVAVVFIASEYATRSIGTTMTAVPKRSMIYFSKLLVLSTYSFIAGLVFSLLGFFASYLILNPDLRAQLPFESGVLFNCLGMGLYFMMLSWMGLGFGAFMRNNAGGVVMVVFCLFVLPVVLALFTIGFEWVSDLIPYLPNTLGRAMLAYVPDEGDFSNLEAGSYLAIWCLVPAFLGYLRIRFTDPK